MCVFISRSFGEFKVDNRLDSLDFDLCFSIFMLILFILCRRYEYKFSDEEEEDVVDIIFSIRQLSA